MIRIYIIIQLKVFHCDKIIMTCNHCLFCRIAPPEAPVTGYMFGKGVYFADMVSKSANYCSTSRSDNEGLMLLCEVALGDM